MTSVKDIKTWVEALDGGTCNSDYQEYLMQTEINDLRAYAEQLERERELFLTDEQISDKINQHFNYGAVYGSDKAQHYASFIEIRNFVRDILGENK